MFKIEKFFVFVNSKEFVIKLSHSWDFFLCVIIVNISISTMIIQQIISIITMKLMPAKNSKVLRIFPIYQPKSILGPS